MGKGSKIILPCLVLNHVLSRRWVGFNKCTQFVRLPPARVTVMTWFQCLRLQAPLNLPQFITKESGTKVSLSSFSGNPVDWGAYKHMIEQRLLD